MELNEIKKLHIPAHTKLVLLVLDGLGGLPYHQNNLTALEAAQTPHMDQLAREGVCGLHTPIAPGITPGSGPSHLGLFGYDPLKYQVGRGVLSALGIGFDLEPGDVAARGNFCTVDAGGKITDRRAGRISTQQNQELIAQLQDIKVDGIEVILKTVKEYRFLLVLRGDNLSGEIGDTDSQRTGVQPLDARPLNSQALSTAQKVQAVIQQTREILADQTPANMILLRGFSQRPHWPDFQEVYGVRAVAIAAYPMYRGVARLVGMEAVKDITSLEAEFETLRKIWDDYDFFFLHVKPTDSYGEDGNYDGKISVIETVDQHIPQITDLNPDALLITGDHSTPAHMRSHSWHPVPALLWSPSCRPDLVSKFGERACMQGGLGSRTLAKDLMPLLMAHAQRLKKFGA
jgi:2,3-bisphosphoglycerate-independent phosphoglycerate mutase